jgi:hypothetical protein
MPYGELSRFSSVLSDGLPASVNARCAPGGAARTPRSEAHALLVSALIHRRASALPPGAGGALTRRWISADTPAHGPRFGCMPVAAGICETSALWVSVFRAYTSGRQRLTATLCADNKRDCRQPVLGESRSRWLADLRYAKILTLVCWQPKSSPPTTPRPVCEFKKNVMHVILLCSATPN